MKLTAEIIQTLENFQQACVIATGPYNDGHDQLCKFAYGTPGTELTRKDFEWLSEFVTEMASNFESAAQEIDNALIEFDEDMDQIENACVHGEEPDDCDECAAIVQAEEDLNEVEA